MQPNDRTLPGDENVARLLGQAYEPQDVPAEFACRVHARMQAAAAEAARQRLPLPLPRPRGGLVPRRLAWAVGMAAMLGCIAVGVQFGPWSKVPGGHGPQASGTHTAPTPLPAERPSPERLTAGPRPAAAEAATLKPGATLTTKVGERRRVLLADGSVLFVNQKTSLHIDADRRVTLQQGEVFVEVAPRAPETFVVQTPQRAVTALGTKFLVRADDAGTNVAVTQGKVKVSGWDGVLLAGQQLPAGAARVEPAPRFSHLLDWARDLLTDAAGRLVPESQHGGGALVAVDARGQEAKFSLRKYHIDVHIEDGFARTTIDQTYFNHLPSRLEGTFYFPLPADASLSRLAMYVNGDLNEGGMVERDEGRAVYEQIVKKMQDPALLEWLDGTTFKMRVFPLEARQEKRIILSYTQKLPVLYGRSSYRFPAGHSLGEVRDWSFAGRVKNGAGLTWHSDSHSLQARTEGNDLVLEASGRHVKPDRDVVLDLYEQSAKSAPHDDARFSSAEYEGAKYLMVRYRPALPAEQRRQRRDWVFLFESSGDRDPLLARTQVEVVRTLLANAEHDDTFAVLAAGARVHSFDTQPRPATPENVAAAIAFLEKAHLVGALDLEKALTASEPLLASSDNPHLVHVGSGLAALGERRADLLARKVPAHMRYVGVGVGKRWGRDFMKLAAERTGGAFTQINPDEPIGWRAFELSATLNTPRLLGARVTDPAGKATFLSHATAVAQGEELCAITRLDGNTALPAKVTITGTLDGRPYERTLEVADVRPKADYLPRTWAKLEIERLLAENFAGNKDRIVALSKSMYVMTPYTSLLVLENEAMYAQFKVDRGRKDHWAMYPCPPKIPVVYEPLPGMAGATPAAATGKPTAEQVLTTLVFSPDGTRLATGAKDGTVRLWDVTSGKENLNEITDQKKLSALTTYTRTPSPVFSFYTGLFDDRRTSTPQGGPGPAATTDGRMLTLGLSIPIKTSSFAETTPQRGGYTSGFGFNPYTSWNGSLGWAEGRTVPGASTYYNLDFSYRGTLNTLYSEDGLDPTKLYKLHTATEAYGLTQLNRQLEENGDARMNTWLLNPLAQRNLPRTAFLSPAPGQQPPDELLRERLKAPDLPLLVGKPLFQTYRIPAGNAKALETDLRAIFPPGASLRITADGEYAIRVYGTPEDQENIKQKIDQNREKGLKPEIIDVGTLSAPDTADKLKDMLGDATKGASKGAPYIASMNDRNALMIRGTPDQVEEARQIVVAMQGGGDMRKKFKESIVSSLTPQKTYQMPSMQGRPWAAVFRWLSDETSLNVVRTFTPTGTFTFTNPQDRRYTLPEMVDIINKGLLNNESTQRYLLIRRDRNFTLVRADEKLNPDLLRKVTPEQLVEHGNTEIVQCEKQLTSADPETLAPRFRKVMGDSGEVIAMPGKRLILRGAVSDIMIVLVQIDRIEHGRIDRIEYGPTFYLHPQTTLDIRFFRDLLAFAPGLSTSAADVRAVLEVEAGLGDDVRPGKVDPAAREMIDRARTTGWYSLTVPGADGRNGFTVTLDGKGRYRWDRVLPWGLRETVVCDGQTLLHLYPDLGLAARRPWSRYHAAEFRQLVPWLLQTAGELARGADLRRVDEHTVAVVIPDSPIVHLVFGDDGRLTERKVLTSDGTVLARETYAADGTVHRFDADGKEVHVSDWTVRSAAKPDLSPDLEELVVLTLPVRTRQHVLRGQPIVPTNISNQTALDLLLSDEVFGTPTMADLIREKFLKKGDQRIGFHTLLLASGQPLGMEPPAAWRDDRPLERYCRQVENFSRDRLVWTGGPLNTFWERMGAFHEVFSRWQGIMVMIDAAEARRLLRFVSECGSLPTAWAATDLVLRNTANKEEGKQDANGLKKKLIEVICKATEGSPNLHYAARYQQARLFHQIGEKQKAAELFTDLYTRTAAQGVLPAIDGDFRAALTAERSWDKLLRQTAVNLIVGKHRPAVVALAEQAAALGDVSLAGELIDLSLKDADGKERPALQLAGVQHQMRHGQFDKADRLFDELMRDDAAACRADLWRLGVALSQTRNQTPRAMTRLERALDLEYAVRPEVIDLEAVRRDFGQLLAHYEKVAEATNLLQQSPPADFTDRVVRFADRWRSLDKDAPAPCEAAVRILNQVGASDLAWDYRTTPLTQQAEPNAWLQLAREKSAQGDVEHADRAFAAAFALNPANPEALWERATNLSRPAPTPAARALFREVLNGDWGANTPTWKEKSKAQLAR
jgi:ferric-dicitrate binding protein FerR (iron transport regulator)/tetratricopeptide (TPR) repeat protein